jgi:hypothetical protein
MTPFPHLMMDSAKPKNGTTNWKTVGKWERGVILENQELMNDL